MQKKELDLEEIKKIELEILKEIDEICEKNNLNYSLMGGTALGAVRHRGFIPWDDDIDIMMLREEYLKLQNYLKNEHNNKIKFLSCETQDDFPYPFAKIVSTKTIAKEVGIKRIENYGVFVDIFPIDKIPNSNLKRRLFFKKMKLFKKIYLVKLYEKQISKNKLKLCIKNIIATLLKPINLRKLVKKMDKVSQKYNKEKSDYWGSLYVEATLNKNIFYERGFFSNTRKIKFENERFYLIEEYDRYLKDNYGDYMKIPDKENQVSGHNWEYIQLK